MFSRLVPRGTYVFAFAAIVLTIAYAAYLAPDWDPARDDQRQYVALARGLVERGEYTHARVGEPFIPEPLRFPGYPLFLAPLCVSGCDPWVIAVAQAIALAALVLLTAHLARPLLGARGAVAAAALVALNPAFSFFAAHALSDLLATLLFAGAAIGFTSLSGRPRMWSGAGAGLLAAALVLTRPFLIFGPPLFALIAMTSARTRRAAGALVAALFVFLLAVTPYIAYTEVNFGRPVAGSTGAQLWLGYFQGRSPEQLDAFERGQAEAGRSRLAAFDAIADRLAQAHEFVALDDELRSRAFTLIAHDPAGFVVRGVVRSVELWAGDVPLRADTAAVAEIRAIWMVLNLALLGIGIAGAIRLSRLSGPLAVLPLAVIAATWIVSYPFWAEGRFSLPARPFLSIGAVAFFALARRRSL